MSNHCFTVRLDTGYEDEKQAWDKLKRLQRKTHLSYNRIVTDAAQKLSRDKNILQNLEQSGPSVRL